MREKYFGEYMWFDNPYITNSKYIYQRLIIKQLCRPKRSYVFTLNISYLCPTLTKTGMWWQILVKVKIMYFSKKKPFTNSGILTL
jgi:hypothetical protein